MKISLNAINNVDNHKKRILKERAQKIYNSFNDYYLYKSIEYRVETALEHYRYIYKEKLNISEVTIFALYVAFPDDINFMQLMEKYGGCYKRISNLYGINEKFVELRHCVYQSLNGVKTLNLKK